MFRRSLGAMLVALLAGVGAPYVTPAQAASGGCAASSAVPTSGADRTDATRAVACLVNHQRAARGLRPLRPSWPLTRAARAHSADMVARGYFGHDSPAGDTLADRVRRSGYLAAHPGAFVDEALAWGSAASPSVLMVVLMRSPVHRAILLDPAARDVGVGLTLGAPAGGVAGPCATLVLDVGT